MAKGIRINQLAKDLGVESKAILAKCRDEGLGEKVPNHMSVVSVGLAETIKEWFAGHDAGGGGGTAVETAPPVEAKPKAARSRAKKKADAAKRIADRAAMDAAAAADRAAFEGAGIRGVDAEAFANPLLPQTPEAAVTTEEPVTDATNGDRMPGADEATEGASPEITTHSEKAFGDGQDLSPEEQAVQIPGSDDNGDPAGKDFADEDADTAALAEGRAQPPAGTRSEPA